VCVCACACVYVCVCVCVALSTILPTHGWMRTCMNVHVDMCGNKFVNKHVESGMLVCACQCVDLCGQEASLANRPPAIHFCYDIVTRLLHCCYTTLTMLLHYCYTVV
jgi:hypothetical protein